MNRLFVCLFFIYYPLVEAHLIFLRYPRKREAKSPVVFLRHTESWKVKQFSYLERYFERGSVALLKRQGLSRICHLA